eukprot:jgi/Botrbrau1/6063/Bobra.177_1s0003.1
MSRSCRNAVSHSLSLLVPRQTQMHIRAISIKQGPISIVSGESIICAKRSFLPRPLQPTSKGRALVIGPSCVLEAGSALHHMGLAQGLGFSDAVLQWRQPYRDGLLTKEELQQYWEQGFVVKHNVFTSEELQPSKDAITRCVDQVAKKLHQAGKITDVCEDVDFYHRLTALEAQFPNASVLVHKQGILPPEIADLWGCKKLMSAARQLLGDDIGGHPVWNVRAKTPQQEQATVPWHQDNAYLHPESWQVHQVTAWIPLCNATHENGCMQVLRRGHRSAKTARHTCCVGGTWYVMMDLEDAKASLGVDEEVDLVTCEVPQGGVLFLNNLIPHRSTNNLSSGIRWSLDLRWQNPAFPNGFYGLKPSILMAKSDQPEFQPDWKEWAQVERTSLQAQAVSIDENNVDRVISTAQNAATESPTEDEFDTTIAGPWMDRWEMTHHNRHTAAHMAAVRAGKGSESWTFA